MSRIAIENAVIVLKNQKLENQSVVIENGCITEISSARVEVDRRIDLEGNYLIAGFIDIHNHGAIGIDVNQTDAEGLYKISKFLISNGVTAWLPTLVPDTDENYKKVIKAIDEIMQVQKKEPIAQILGVHYEGIFANKHMCGALRPEFFKTFKENELDLLPVPRNGIRMMTLAPEIEGGLALIEELKRRKWIISIGHTKADVKTLEESFSRGAKHLTHFFNAMNGIHHREIGVAGWGLIKTEVTFDIIADKIHVHPDMLKLACHVKTPEKVSLISDSIAPTGLGNGLFELWGQRISVSEGRTRNEKGNIAGSVITMLDGFKNMISLGFSIEEVSKMTSLNPAKLLGLDTILGSIDQGKIANLIALNKELEVTLAMVRGDILTF